MPPQQINPSPSIQEQGSAVSPILQNTWNKFALLALGTFALSFLIYIPWVNTIAHYFGGGIVTSLVGIILPFLTLFFAIKAIRGIHKNGGKGKLLSWAVLLLNLIILYFAVISAMFFFAFAGLSINNFTLTNSAVNENNNIPPANESIEIVGPTPESERSIIENQAKANNNINFYFNESGTAVGYGVGEGFTLEYVENGVVHGPPITGQKQYPESDEQFWTRMEAMGLKVGMRPRWEIGNSDSKSGHSLESIPTGPELNCFDSQSHSQSSLMYDGKQVGLHSVQDGRCRSPVRGVLLSNDGLHYAYLVQAKHGYFVVVDGKKSEIYPLLSNLHFEGSTFVFNAVSSDFMNFVRAKITTSTQGIVANTTTGEQVANIPTAPLDYGVLRLMSPNGGETFKIGSTVRITWDVKNPPAGIWLDLELFEISGDKPNIASSGQCLNCTGGGLRSGVQAISPITNGVGGIDWAVGKIYAGGYVKPGSHYILKANISKTGSSSECPAKFSGCTVDLDVDWSDAAFSLTN